MCIRDRATAAVIQTLVAWGVIVLLDAKQRRFGIGQPILVSNPDMGIDVYKRQVYWVGI